MSTKVSSATKAPVAPNVEPKKSLTSAETRTATAAKGNFFTNWFSSSHTAPPLAKTPSEDNLEIPDWEDEAPPVITYLSCETTPIHSTSEDLKARRKALLKKPEPTAASSGKSSTPSAPPKTVTKLASDVKSSSSTDLSSSVLLGATVAGVAHFIFANIFEKINCVSAGIVGGGLAIIVPSTLSFIDERVKASTPEKVSKVATFFLQGLKNPLAQIAIIGFGSRLIDTIPNGTTSAAVLSGMVILTNLFFSSSTKDKTPDPAPSTTTKPLTPAPIKSSTPKATTGHVHTSTCGHSSRLNGKPTSHKHTHPETDPSSTRASTSDVREPEENASLPKEESFFTRSAKFLEKAYEGAVSVCKIALTKTFDFLSYLSRSISELFLGKEESESV